MTNSAHGHSQIEALADAARRAVLEQLLNGPIAVGDLAKRFPVSRPAISQHLAVLKRAHLVSDRPEGNRRVSTRAWIMHRIVADEARVIEGHAEAAEAGEVV